jgi:hypothetical protein
MCLKRFQRQARPMIVFISLADAVCSMQVVSVVDPSQLAAGSLAGQWELRECKTIAMLPEQS